MTDELLLRRLLWLRHGCPSHALYGDDGEMQCHACMVDFRRDTPERIDERFLEINASVVAAYFKSLRKE